MPVYEVKDVNIDSAITTAFIDKIFKPAADYFGMSVIELHNKCTHALKEKDPESGSIWQHYYLDGKKFMEIGPIKFSGDIIKGNCDCKLSTEVI